MTQDEIRARVQQLMKVVLDGKNAQLYVDCCQSICKHPVQSEEKRGYGMPSHKECLDCGLKIPTGCQHPNLSGEVYAFGEAVHRLCLNCGKKIYNEYYILYPDPA